MVTLDDIHAAIERNTAALRADQDLIVGTAEACRRLGGIGWDHLDDLVKAKRIARVVDMRGPGNGHLYAVRELQRFADTGVTTDQRHLRSAS